MFDTSVCVQAADCFITMLSSLLIPALAFVMVRHLSEMAGIGAFEQTFFRRIEQTFSHIDQQFFRHIEQNMFLTSVSAQPVRLATSGFSWLVMASSEELRKAARRMVGVAPVHSALTPSSRATRTTQSIDEV